MLSLTTDAHTSFKSQRISNSLHRFKIEAIILMYFVSFE